MAKDGPKGKVIDFRSARKSAESPAQMKATANAPSSPRSGYLDAWLKNHEDSQSLIQENLRLRNLQAGLHVSTREYGLYLVSLFLYGVILIVWALNLV